MDKALPLGESERLSWIDAARGFAIFGIFIVNIGIFSAPYFFHGGAEDAWTEPIDQYTLIVKDIFFQASFYTLFSILFGFGFQLMKERLELKNIGVHPFMFRRLFILICFGFIHAFFIWSGDILLSYGIIGLFLIAFLYRSDKTLLVWAFLLLGGIVTYISRFLYDVRYYLQDYDVAAIYLAKAHYQRGDLSIILKQNANDWFYANSFFSSFLSLTTLLPLFLIGMYIARKRWLHKPVLNKRLLKIGWTVSLIVFVCLKMGPYLYGNPDWFYFIQDNVGGAASALFYLFSITLLSTSRLGNKILKLFTYVGRMSLTNYIAQSVVSFFLFYGVGFGWYGQITPFMSIGIVVLIFIVQIFLSKWWLSQFRFGPLEWIWRSLTYLNIQPIRRRGA
ncbi:DUF418 domain-containing protein [Virgibacillus oceani]|uniref:DUF418 domain-containing protein n=1 Tax=Virgibacillus oceani TaxID=1479511 RepID=A0A917HDX1_9BACI|nr:DUF418 domain-containing protein [Virgibacillus oceani]GGG75275.1 hypothetical protein GCM10011398_20090 [Virgibacillus oceani]